MLDVRGRKYVDFKAILEFYKSELESENKSFIHEALRRYSIVSKVVGKEYSELYLLPLMLRMLEIGSYEINRIVSEELVNIIDSSVNYKDESKLLIGKICSNLLFNEESSIRIESVKSIELIFSKFKDENLIFSFVEEVLLPIIKDKCNISGTNYSSSGSSLTDKLSFCNIIPTLILPYCTKIEKNNVLLLFLSLCDDEVPSLRMGASQQLVHIIKKIFPLKCGMNQVEYQNLKLTDQRLITERLLNLVVSFYKDQTCDVLKSASVGIAIQLYTNPVFYIEYVSLNDRESLLNFMCSALIDRQYSQRETIIGELVPICLSLKGYYELGQDKGEEMVFKGYASNSSSNILSDIGFSCYSLEIVTSIFEVITKEEDIGIKLSTFKFFRKLLKMGIDIYESHRDLLSNESIEFKRRNLIDEIVDLIIIYLNNSISDLLMITNSTFKCIFCETIVLMIIYIQHLLDHNSVNTKSSIKVLEYQKLKDMFIRVFISYFNDQNINVVSTAIENLYKIIGLVSDEQLNCHIFPKIKTIIFVEVDNITNNKFVEKTTGLQKWRIVRCIIRQIPLWIRFESPCIGIYPFYNSIIVRSILDNTFSVSVSALQTIMRIISEFKSFDECKMWVNEFIVDSILSPYIENISHSIQYTFDVNHKKIQNKDEFAEKKNIERYEYKIQSCNYMNRIIIMNLIFAVYRSLLYKWVYTHFIKFKTDLSLFISGMNNLTHHEESNYRSIVLSDILQEDVFERFSKLVTPIIMDSIDDPIINVSITTSQLVVQIIKIFSFERYLNWEKETFSCSSFGEANSIEIEYYDELLKEHLLSQFELDSVWHFRNIMSNCKIDNKNSLFPKCIYKELLSVFKKYSEIEYNERDTEFVSIVNSIVEWYNASISEAT
ncbi:HEAT repeat family protein [Cryptosporidium felis]|nr:HEAT repeat family protein [Cryptosporidium felis]